MIQLLKRFGSGWGDDNKIKDKCIIDPREGAGDVKKGRATVVYVLRSVAHAINVDKIASRRRQY